MIEIEERKEKIRRLNSNLTARFNEMVWNDPKKLARLKRLKPNVMEELWKRWDELEIRCAEYLDSKIEWSGDSIQMEFTSTGQPNPSLDIQRDVENYGRDLFCWMVLQVKDI